MKHPLLEEHYDNHRWVTVHRYLGDQSHQTALSPWLYNLSRQFLDYNRTPTEKAWETAGDAILNYESYIITTLEYDFDGHITVNSVNSAKTVYRNPHGRSQQTSKNPRSSSQPSSWSMDYRIVWIKCCE
jgi:hypothetical protein